MQWKIGNAKTIEPHVPLVVFGWEAGKEEKASRAGVALPNALPAAAKALVEEALERKEFCARLGEGLSLHGIEEGKQWRLMLVGTGDRAKWNREQLTRSFSCVGTALRSGRLARAALVLPKAFLRVTQSAHALGVCIANGLALGTYTFTQYKSVPEAPREIEEVTVISEASVRSSELRAGLAEGEIIALAIRTARDWTNMPSNDATPAFFALQAQKIAKAFPKIRCVVFDKAEIKKRGMGGVYGVSKGANEHPRFIVLEYWGSAKTAAPLALCGKAVTFDSGGISIKPAEKMEEMKYDMAGGAAVICAIRAIAALKLPVNVVGVVPATENLPSGEAYKPGDILTTLSGKTIEVVNTDAEGRVILADALEYAKQYKPLLCVDIATLTGAVSVALGNSVCAIVGSAPKVIKALRRAGEAAGEALWELPLLDEYREYVKSDVADLKNITGRRGGVISGAAFLAAFAEPMPWAHLDIGGTAYTNEAKPWMGKGATGWGVHLFVELAKQFAKRRKR